METISSRSIAWHSGSSPGKRVPHPARNTTMLSDHYLAKHVAIGYKNLPHAIEYRVTFLVPGSEKHHFVQFEPLQATCRWSSARFSASTPRRGSCSR